MTAPTRLFAFNRLLSLKCGLSKLKADLAAAVALDSAVEAKAAAFRILDTPDCVMQNLIGDEVHSSHAMLAAPGAVLHLNSKKKARSGQKMGHVARLGVRTAWTTIESATQDRSYKD